MPRFLRHPAPWSLRASRLSRIPRAVCACDEHPCNSTRLHTFRTNRRRRQLQFWPSDLKVCSSASASAPCSLRNLSLTSDLDGVCSGVIGPVLHRERSHGPPQMPTSALLFDDPRDHHRSGECCLSLL
ncbi:hypothetical protein BV20DRAFT_512641 [Pilatotrama ljubarskyi]|nr:hypothetical protein BV20DRAFT_512641 [Pilatotrama ljubarskyi]